MVEAAIGLDNRELAIAIWLFIGAAFALRSVKVRRSTLAVIRAAVAWPMPAMWSAMILYIVAEVLALSAIGLWDESHLKHTALWTLTVAIALLVKVTPTEMRSFRDASLQTFNITVFFDFVVNLHPYSLIVELILAPCLFIFAGAWALSRTKEEYKQAERVLSTTLAIVGAVTLLYSISQIYSNWSSFARIQTAKDFLVPLALSLLFLPFVYLCLLYAAYERHFKRMWFYVPDPHIRRLFKWRSVLYCHISATRLERLTQRLRANQIRSKTDIRALFGSSDRADCVPPEGHRSLKWGDQPTDQLEQYSGDHKLSLYKPLEYSPFLGLPIKDELFGFCNGKLYLAMVWVHGKERAAEARVRLAALYGSPTFANEYKGLWKWKWKGGPIEIQLWFEADRDHSSITITNTSIE